MARTGKGVFHAEHGMDAGLLSLTEVNALEPVGRYVAITPAPSGTMFVTSNFRGGIHYGRLSDPGYFFSYGGELTGNKATPTLQDRDGDSLWVAVKHQGTVDYDRGILRDVFREVLLQLRLP